MRRLLRMLCRPRSEGPDVCVLLVEDESLIREIMAEGLQEAGFEVRAAEDGEAAVAMIRSESATFSALVTDFHMPGRHDGAAVAGCMRKLAPGTPVVIATGRPEVFQAEWGSTFGYSFLRKPYTAADLVGLLNRIMPQS